MTATATQRNGTSADVTFPLDSFKDAAVHLRRPFTTAAVKFKVQATWPKQDPTGGLIVAYIDARLAIERLNLIVPHLWHDEYEPLGAKHLICRLTVDGITRQDIGEGVGKGLYSDALKRAAVKFGIGVSLYASPSLTLRKGQHLEVKQTRDGLSLVLTATGESECRRRYAAWLESHGRQAFGDPLDHGDLEGAQGDAEVDGEPAAAQETGEVVTAADIQALGAAAKGLTIAQVKLAMGSVGVDAPVPFVGKSAFNAVPKAKAAQLATALSGMERET